MSIFLLGLLVGCILGIFIHNEFQRISLKQVMSVLKKEIYRAYEEGVKFGSAQPKIERINEISKEQAGYLGALDRPNASAAHARHKNSVVNMIKKLEEEKLSLFRSILDSGADPMLTVAIDGETKNMRVSALLPILEGVASQLSEKTETKSPSVTQGLRLIADNTKENRDVQPKPSNPEIH